MKKQRINKLICLFLVILACLSLCACGKEDKQIERFADLSGRNLAVALGTTNAFVVKDKGEEIGSNVMYTLTAADAFAMLISEKADAYAVDNIAAQSLVRSNEGLTIVDEGFEKEGYGIALQKNSKYTNEFNAALKELINNGSLTELADKWLLEGTDKSVKFQNWAGSNGTLSCRVSADLEPFCYKDSSGNLLGYDIDLLLLIAEKLDYKIEFSFCDFSDLLPSLADKQIDLAVGGISITDERLEKVDFTDQYFETSTVLLVRDLSFVKDDASFFESLKAKLYNVFIEEDRWLDFVQAMGMSLKIVLTSFVTGCIFGFLTFLLRYSGSKIARFILDGFESILGYLPGVAWILFVFYIVLRGNSANNFWAAILAFTVSFGFGVYGQLLGAVNAVDPGQVEAATSMGYSKYKGLFKIFLPQALPRFFGGLQGEVIGLIKISSLVEFIGVLDVQTVADAVRAQTFQAFEPLIFAFCFYGLFAYVASKLIGFVGKKLSREDRSEDVIRKDALRGKI